MDTKKNKNIYNKNDNIDGNKEFTIRFDLIKNLYDDMPSIVKKKIELKDCLVNKNGQIKIKEYKTKDGKVIPAIYLANNNSIVFRILEEDGRLNNIVFKKFKDLKEKEQLENVKKTLIDLKDDRNLVIEKYCNDKGYCCVTDNSNYKIGIRSFKNNNMTVCCDEDEIRIMGRTASGVKGINLCGGKAVGMELSTGIGEILVVTEKGYGKKTDKEQYRMTHRGSKGVKALNVTEKNGNIVAFKFIHEDENLDLMVVTDSGIIIRLPLSQISSTGRVAQGVRLINLKENQKVSTIAIVEKTPEENIEDSEDNVSRETLEIDIKE